MGIFIKCDESVQICDKSQYREASLGEKIKHIVHLAFCIICRKYTIRNMKLTKLLKKSNLKTLSVDDKNKLKKKLQTQINQQ